MAERLDRPIAMVRGDSYNIDFLLTDSSGNALDLDGYSATMTVNELAQPDTDDSPAFVCVGTIVAPSTDGRIRFTPTTSDTDLEPGTYWYDLQTVSSLNHVRTPAGGAFTIIQDITKTSATVWTPDSEPASGSTVDPSGADGLVWWTWSACDSELQYYDETEQVPLTSRRCVRAVHTGANWDSVNGCPQLGVLPPLRPGWQVSFYVYLSVAGMSIYLKAPSTEISWSVDQTKTLAGGDAWGVYQGLSNNAYKPEYQPEDPVAVRVPATVQAALFDAGRIEDPYWEMNNEEILWVEQKEWWYFRDLEIPAEIKGRKYQLVFEGITYSGVDYIDGTITNDGMVSGTMVGTFEMTNSTGTFTGQLTGNTLVIDSLSHDTAGETCTTTGSLTATR